MKILTIGSDAKIFEPTSRVSQRLREQGDLVDEYHVLSFTRSKNSPRELSLSSSTTVYAPEGKSLFSIFFATLRLAKHIVNVRNIDLVSAQDPFFSGMAAYIVARLTGLPLHLQLHTDIGNVAFRRESIKHRFFSVLARFLLSRAQRIRVVSPRIKDFLVRSWLMPSERIDVIPIFVDVEHFKNAPVQMDLHAKYPEFRPLVLMLSRLSPEKNISLGIVAVEQLTKISPCAGLVVVGEGIELELLKSKVKQRKLEKIVRFESWCEDPASYYKTADCLLVTSKYEGYGLTIVEALAAGTPVVSTDVGIAPQTGARIVSANPPVLAAEIQKSLSGKGCLRYIPSSSANREQYRNAMKESWDRTSSLCYNYPAMLTSLRKSYYWWLRWGQRYFPRIYQLCFCYRVYTKYLFAGTTAGVTDLVFLFVFIEFFHFHYLVSVILAFLLAFWVSFALHKFWTFRDHSFDGITTQVVHYFVLAGSNLVLNTLLMYFLVDIVALRATGVTAATPVVYLSAQIVTSLLLAIESFLISRFFIFHKGNHVP